MSTRILLALFVLISLVACQNKFEKYKNENLALDKIILSDSLISPNEDSLVKVQIKNYEEMAKLCKSDTESANYYNSAADRARAIGQFDKAISLYETINQKYPNSVRAPYSLFLQAFTYENNLKQIDKAKKIYESFLQKYPNHELVKDVNASLKYLGKSPEELIKMFEENNKNLIDSTQKKS